MCGRFTLTASPAELAETFAEFTPPDELQPRYNIAPTQPVAAVANDGQNKIEYFHWGLIPFWAKDPAIGNRMINARAETLPEKPAFRTAYRRRRCLVLADGFYEWNKAAKDGEKPVKTPFYISLESGEPFAFAGLWETWNSPEEALIRSCTIITTTPNELVAGIHNRMPVILPRAAYEQWLDPAEQSADSLNSLLVPYPASSMRAYPVSRLVNSPSNDRLECIAPLPGAPEAWE